MPKEINEAKVLQLQKNIPIFLLDSRNEIAGVNTEFTRITGFRQKEIKLRKIFSLLSRGSVRSFHHLLKECKKKKIVSAEFEILKRDEVPQSARIFLIENQGSGTITGIINIVDNVGQLRAEIDAVNSIADHNLKKLLKTNEKLQSARKAEQEALGVKEKFLTNISHELRTPLTGISGITQLLSNTELNALQREYVETIQHSTDHLVRMINELLDLSKLKSEKFELELQQFSLKEILKNLASSFSIICEKKNITFNFYFDKKIPPVLIGDSLRISQIINNLLSNAYKFTDKGYIYLKVELSKIAKQTATINFEITDTGIGIEKEKLKTIFDEFQQGGTAIARIYGGTGLGLSISQHLVRLQNGEISVSSKLGKGSSFTFSLSFQIGAALKKRESKSSLRLKGKKVLIADDNRVNILVIENILKKEGAFVQSSINGKEALKKYKSDEYDLVILDLNMPELDGYQVAEAINKYKKNNTPLIAVTASSSQAVEKKCKEAGFTSVIYKPFTNEDFISKLVKFIPNNISSTNGKSANLNSVNKNSRSLSKKNQILESIAQGDQDVYNNLIQTICENIRNDLPLAKTCILNKENEKAAALIHKIKTSYGYLEMNKELEVLSEIEIMLKRVNNNKLVMKKIKPLLDRYPKLISSLEAQIVK